MNNQRIYMNEVSPLEEVNPKDVITGELYIWSNGTRVRAISEGTFEIDKASELVDDEVVEELTPKQLELFWKLMRNRIL